MLAFASVLDRCAGSCESFCPLGGSAGISALSPERCLSRSQLKPSAGQEKLSWECPEARLEGTMGGGGLGTPAGMRGGWAEALHSSGGDLSLSRWSVAYPS